MKLRSLSSLNFRKIFLSKPFLIGLLLVVLAGGAWYGIATIQQNRAEHDAFIGDIENLYYYLKREPRNLETFAILREGDSVAISAWQNYLSTSNTIVRNHERMIVEHMADYTHYKEIVLVEKLKEALEVFKDIRTENLERVEGRPEYSMQEFEEKKNKLVTKLADIAKLGRELGVDLR